MNKREWWRDKMGKGVLARCAVVCIAAAFIGSFGIPGLARGAEVTVNAPEYVEGTFNATIDVDSITKFNSAQFDLSFDSHVVNVTGVAKGSVGGETVPVDRWELMGEDRIRVIPELSGIAGVNGSGYLAEICFDVLGSQGERSVLDISNGMLVDTEADEIPAEWIDDEVIAGQTPVNVVVNAPKYVEGTFNATIDVDSITNFNSAQFDLSFDSHVVNVTGVADGCIGGETVPVDRWVLMAEDRIRVILDLSGTAGVNGSGYLAEICFDVVGLQEERSVLDISNGMLVDTGADEIPAEWFDDAVIVGPRPVNVVVNAPKYVEGTFNATIDVDSITKFNSAQFDLSFDSHVVNVTGVAKGSVGGETVPVDRWEHMAEDRIRVIPELSGIAGVNGSGYIADIGFDVVGSIGDRSVMDISNGMLVDTEAEEILAEWIDAEITVEEKPVFDTGPGTYPSISGTHEGTIDVYDDITVEKLYTYPCAGTGGHSKYVMIGNATWNVSAVWNGYTTGDYHTISFSGPFTLYAGEPYNYTIKTGSYPQIHHRAELDVVDSGILKCAKFTDANGNLYDDWIPAIALW